MNLSDHWFILLLRFNPLWHAFFWFVFLWQFVFLICSNLTLSVTWCCCYCCSVLLPASSTASAWLGISKNAGGWKANFFWPQPLPEFSLVLQCFPVPCDWKTPFPRDLPSQTFPGTTSFFFKVLFNTWAPLSLSLLCDTALQNQAFLCLLQLYHCLNDWLLKMVMVQTF